MPLWQWVALAFWTWLMWQGGRDYQRTMGDE
jgi:hypothetical protein